MTTWKDYLTKNILRLEQNLDKLNKNRRLQNDTPLEIKTYLSYGNKNKALVRARVLEYKDFQKPSLSDSSFKNFRRNLGYFASAEIANAKVRLRYNGFEQILEADEEGFVEEILDLPLIGEGLVETVDLDLLEPNQSKQIKKCFQAPIVRSKNPNFGIISDIDDTIIKTDVKNLFKLAKNTIFGNAQSKEIFEGAANFYHALSTNKNPIFYVSSSPWNLYDTLLEVFETNDLPLGPLILRDWGISKEELIPTENKKHKVTEIKRVLNIYPELKFILVGDSGQQDPEIYAQIVADYPERIMAVYIRDVSDFKRDKELEALARKLENKSVPLVLAQTSSKFLADAINRDFT